MTRSQLGNLHHGQAMLYYYHGMHPVVALGVWHEGLAQLVHLLIFQLLKQR